MAVYLRGVLQLRWQRWLTTRLVDRWLADRNYYRLRLERRAEDVAGENPDQRIQEDVEDATRNTIEFAAGLLTALASVISFGGLLWALSAPTYLAGVAIPGSLLWFALGYAASFTGVAHLVSRRVAPLNFVRQRFRGDFRVSLVNVPENAEEIAFLRGERAEAAMIGERFSRYWRVALRLLGRNTGLLSLSNMTGQLAIIFPTVIAAPRFLSEDLDWHAKSDPPRFLSARRLGAIGRYDICSAGRLRVAAGAARGSRGRARSPPAGIAVRSRRGSDTRRSRVHVPGHDKQVVVGPLSLSLRRGISTAITGPSGSGKTTLLRILAGLWWAPGRIELPFKAAFVPQRASLP